jgi:hypothetical protein
MSRRVLVVAGTMLLPLGLMSCAGQDQRGSPAHRLSVWVGGTGLGGDIGALVADNQRVPKDVPNGTGAVHAACGTLEIDAQMANGELPSPDNQVTDLLSKAYGLEGTAGTECYNAGATNSKLLAQSERNAVKADALYQQVLARIRAVDGQAVATTTTTDNNPGGIFG